MYRTINIKKDMPDSKFAIIQLENEIRFAKLEGISVLIVIHGYGSNGVGGLIKSESLKLLIDLKKRGEIIDFIPGENFGETSENKIKICEKFPDLILNENLQNYNNGVTVVWVI